jgi:hypothetical protein
VSAADSAWQTKAAKAANETDLLSALLLSHFLGPASTVGSATVAAKSCSARPRFPPGLYVGAAEVEDDAKNADTFSAPLE